MRSTHAPYTPADTQELLNRRCRALADGRIQPRFLQRNQQGGVIGVTARRDSCEHLRQRMREIKASGTRGDDAIGVRLLCFCSIGPVLMDMINFGLVTGLVSGE